MSEANYQKSNILEIVIYLFFFAMAIGIPLFMGLSAKGFEESFIPGKAFEFGSYLSNFLVYIPFFIVGILCIIYPITRAITLKPNEHPATAPNPKWHRILSVSYIFSPEEGLLYRIFGNKKNNPFRWLKNPLIVIWFSILGFSLFGLLLIANPQIAVSGTSQLQLQQVTPATEVTFNALVPAVAENGILLFFFLLFMGINAYICAKFRLGIWSFFAIGFFICILMGLMWMSFHFLAKGNDEASLIGTFIFGFVGSLMTMITAQCFSWFVWHFDNNGALSLLGIVTFKEDVLIIVSLIWFLLTALTIGIIWYKKKKKKLVYGIPN